MNRIIRYGEPDKGAWQVVVPKEISQQNIYKALEWFSQQFPDKLPEPHQDKYAVINLSTMVNLHNIEGVSNVQTMRELVGKIKNGKNIYNLDNGSPNVHLAHVGSQWVVINGHHTIMAYLLCGATKVAQLPYAIIGNGPTGDISEDEILSVFNDHATKVRPNEWQDVVLDWSAPSDQQLTARNQKNMGELTSAFVNRFGSDLSL
ncbi:MAG: hypothetical protein NUV80_05840 [Candidatus Berkelbacteria bacterium]|nr:hypothetical protein [Candidatus Berkelbacteria bacterium]MCR4308056.1 hypothetical protein [Candidatus Berkelbacteria bacterium]